MARLSLSLLGPVQISLDGQPLTKFRTNNARVLLVYLAMHAGDFYNRPFLAAMLWPEAAPAAANTSLRQTLYNLRQLLGDAEAEQPFLRMGHGSLGFNPESDFQIDVLDFGALLEANNTHAHRELENCADCMLRLQTALDLYQGDFLTGLELPPAPTLDEWRLVTQEWLHRQAITALEQLSAYYRHRQAHAEAALALRRLLAFEPWREEDHRQLMQVLALDGQPAAALKQFEACRQTLAQELGTEPEAATQELAEQIRTGQFPPPQNGSGPGPIHVSPQNIAASRLPRAETLFGRREELAQLEAWLGSPQVQLVSILGMGGIGKSSLAIHAARNAAANTAANSAGSERVYQHVLWRSLVNGPPLAQVLTEWLQVLTGHPGDSIPGSPEDQVDLLVTLLSEHPALLVLDNLESILEQGQRRGYFREGYTDYAYLLQAVAEREHRSCLLLTSREKPRLLARLNRGRSGVCTLPLLGLDGEASRHIFSRWSLIGDNQSLDNLSERYSGNPLALELIAETVDTLYDGDTAAFLRMPVTLFGAISDVLDQQFRRLTALERTLLFWLAVEREPRTVDLLVTDLHPPQSHPEVLAALRGLIHRSLVEQASSEDGTLFYLQNVITEYVTERLIGAVCGEIEAGETTLLESHALLKATAEAYVCESQRRMLLQPVVEKLTAQDSINGLQERLAAIAKGLRLADTTQNGYAAGNILNLMLHAEFDLQGMDFSGLTIRQADLQNVQLIRVNLSRATLIDCRFTDTFGPVVSLSISPDDRFLAAGTLHGEVLVWRRQDNQQIARLYPQAGEIWSVAFSPDGKLLACGAGDSHIYLWRVVAEGDAIVLVPWQTLAGHRRTVRSVAFRPDGAQLASASEDGTVHLWAIVPSHKENPEFQSEHVLTDHTDRLFRVVYNRDGSLLASAGADSDIRVWDSATGACRWTLAGHTERIAGLAFSPDGQLLVSGGVDTDIRLWEMQTGVCKAVLDHQRKPLLCVTFSLDGRLLFSAGHGPTIQVWETGSWQPIRQLQATVSTAPQVWSLLLADNHWELLSAGDNIPLQRWDIRSGACTFALHRWTANQERVTFHPSERWVVAGGKDGVMRMWDMEKPELRLPVLVHQMHRQIMRSMEYTADGTRLITASHHGTIRLWNQISAADGSADEVELHLVQEFPQVMSGLSRLLITPDEQHLLTGSEWGELYIWELDDDRLLGSHPLHRIQAHKMGLWALAVHPQKPLAASGGDDQAGFAWFGSYKRGACLTVFNCRMARQAKLTFWRMIGSP